MLLSSFNSGKVEAGCDEAGRGCLAGPVFGAAVIFPKDYKNKEINDSKKLSEKKRQKIRTIIEKDALAFAVESVDNKTIDKINILNASILSMQKSLSKLKIVPEHIIIDGNRFKPYLDIPFKCIVKGDAKYLSIAAASILAKTYRDEYMSQIHKEFPIYDWLKNKGYPTSYHREMIRKHGISVYHRSSFDLGLQYEIEF